MTKEEDEGKLLLRLYKLHDFDKSNLNELLKKESGWDEKRLYGALRPLYNNGYINVKRGSGTKRICNDVIFDQITATGDDIIENPQVFINIFGITIQEAENF